MSRAGAVIAKMKELGIGADKILAIVEVMENVASGPRSAAAERQARYRQRQNEKAAGVTVTHNVTPSQPVTEPVETPPLEQAPLYCEGSIYTNHLSPTETSSAAKRNATPSSKDLFRLEFTETFWPEWPNKTAKPAAQKSFVRARRSHSLEAIMGGLRRYVAGKPADRAWLNPTTFLNQERFNDTPAAIAPRARASPTFGSKPKDTQSRMAMGNFDGTVFAHDPTEPPPASAPAGGYQSADPLSEQARANAGGRIVNLRQTGSGWG